MRFQEFLSAWEVKIVDIDHRKGFADPFLKEGKSIIVCLGRKLIPKL
jgi:hypothetical protein